MDRIKLKSIYASEHLTSPGGETVPVSKLHPDPEKAAKIAADLVSGGYADAVGGATAAGPTVKIGGVSVNITPPAGMTLEEALNALNPQDPEDWTAAGKPSMWTLHRLMGSHDMTRADVDAAFPDFLHPQAKAARDVLSGTADAGKADEGTADAGDAGDDDGEGEWDQAEATAEPKPVRRRGARSNAP